jgi:hypothetical protein
MTISVSIIEDDAELRRASSATSAAHPAFVVRYATAEEALEHLPH